MLELIEQPKDTRTFEICYLGNVIGHLAWRETEDWNSRGHVAYEVSEQWQNKGHATMALKTLLQHVSLEYPEYKQVQICCEVSNIRSRRVVEKCGGERDISRGEVFQDPTDGKWTVSYWVPVKNMIDTELKKA